MGLCSNVILDAEKMMQGVGRQLLSIAVRELPRDSLQLKERS